MINRNKYMKTFEKIALFLVLFLSSLTASAQHWTLHKEDADELTGVPASSRHYMKITGKGMFVVNDDVDVLGFYTDTGSFDYQQYAGDNDKLTLGKFSLYNATGKLIEQVEIMMRVIDEDCTIAIADGSFTSLDKIGVIKVSSWIRNKRGKVRVRIPRSLDSDFDMTVPTFLSQSSQRKKQSTSKRSYRKNK